ncbi:hypothetical protein BH10ACI4_BH10ACI4_07580 [soil metagenome]
MRKILLIQNEQYLDRALQDVCGLMTFEQQHIGKEKQVDLLAVILLPPDAMAQLTAEQQTCDLLRFAGSASPFACDSVSVNGVWLLLTVSQPDLPHHVSRQESLCRVLSLLRSNESVQRVSTIFPVFSPEEDERSIAEQMAYLKNEYPGLSITLFLSIRAKNLPTISNAPLRSRVE